MKSTWKFPFWVQENDGTVTQSTWSFLLVNPSLVADWLFLTLQPSLPRASCPEQNQPPPPNPTDISVEVSKRVFLHGHTIDSSHPSVNIMISSRPNSGPYQQTLEIHAETLLPLLGRPCSSEGSDHSPWEWFQRGLTWGDAELAYWGLCPLGMKIQGSVLAIPASYLLLTLSLSGATVLKGLMHSYGLVVLLEWGRFPPQAWPALPTEGLFIMESWCVWAKNMRDKAILLCYCINLTKILAPLSSGQTSPSFTTI